MNTDISNQTEPHVSRKRALRYAIPNSDFRTKIGDHPSRLLVLPIAASLPAVAPDD
jgi:hypothetical protein